MTKAELTAKKAELREKAEEQVKVYNDAIQSGNYEGAFKADEEITKAVNEYTSIVREECFDECKAAENPMLEAITRLTFATIGTKDTKKGDEKIPVREIIDKDRAIDLLKLHKAVEGGIGADKDWAYKAEKLNFLLTAQKAVDLGVKPDRLKEIHDSYAMSEIAKQIDMGKTPTSKTNILKTLQTIITAMLGDEVTATSHDVNYLMSVYSRKNRKALTVTCANHKYFRGYLAEICNHIVTGNPYDVDFKKAK